MVVLTGNTLTIDQVKRVARGQEEVSLATTAEQKVSQSRKMVEQLVAENRVVYGITTGFGKFSDTRISPAEATRLQENLLKSHAAGTGAPLPEEVVRAMMLLRVNALAKGYSGIKGSTLELLIQMLNRGVIPWIPEQGSVGASGDLVPLAHMALSLLGEGQAYYQDQLISSQLALERAGLKPVQLAGKEGLALINGTQMMAALGVLAIIDSENLAGHADLALALTMEALQGILSPFNPLIHAVRPHPGQAVVGRNISGLCQGSKLVLEQRVDRVQDAYSLRCAPQVHGASRDSIAHVKGIIAREINSATDNPLLFPAEGLVISGGNFHGQPLALGLDYLAMALSELGNIAERRMARLVDASLNNGLEMFLTKYGGLNSGYMIPQYTAASLVSENKVLAGPASIDSIPTSANQEDHVSMGSISARKVRKIIDNLENILAIEIIAAVQGIDLRTDQPIKTLGTGSKIIYQRVREVVEPLGEDRIIYPELKVIKEMIHRGELVQAVAGLIN